MSSLASFIREAERMRSAVPFTRPEPAPRPALHVWENVPTVSTDDKSSIPSLNSDVQGLRKSSPDLAALMEFRSGMAMETQVTDHEMELDVLGEEDIPMVEIPLIRQGDSDPGLCLTRSGVEALRQAVSPYPEIMTLCEAARYLRVGRHAVIEFVRHDDLPATKLAGKWRFKRSMLDHWLEIQFSPYR